MGLKESGYIGYEAKALNGPVENKAAGDSALTEVTDGAAAADAAEKPARERAAKLATPAREKPATPARIKAPTVTRTKAVTSRTSKPATKKKAKR